MLPSRRPAKLRPIVQLDPEMLRSEIFTRGLRCLWEQSAECPCTDVLDTKSSAFTYGLGSSVTSGQAQEDCPMCNGQGYFYHSSQEIYALVTAAHGDMERFSVYGEYARAMASFTTNPEHQPQYLDRFTILDTSLVFRDHATRTANAIESLRYPVVRREHDLEWGVTPRGVLYAHKADGARLGVVGGELVETVDFDVTTDGKIDWTKGDISGSAPTVGNRYTMTYYCHPVYVVMSFPHSIRATQTKYKRPDFMVQYLSVQSDARLEFVAPVVR